MFDKLKIFLKKYLGKWWWVIFPIAVVPFVVGYVAYKVWMSRITGELADAEKLVLEKRKILVESELRLAEVVEKAELAGIDSKAEIAEVKAELEHNNNKRDIEDEAEKEKRRIAADDSVADDAVDDLLS